MNTPSPRTILLSVATLGFFVILSSCSGKEEVVLPVGPQTLTGALSSVELSLTRRGTHILRLNGRDVYYVESNMINLRTYEGMDVSIEGALEKNSDPASLPVLVAKKVTLVEEPSHAWTVPALHLTFSAPLQWHGDVFDDGISFTQTGSTLSLLKILRSSLAELPTGTPLVVGGQRAVRIDTSSGQVIYVQNGKDILAITLDKSLQGTSGKEPVKSVLHILKSFAFTNTSSSGSGAIIGTGTGAVAGSPCGGAAGILCPSGSYCAITDQAAGIGVCRLFAQ